MKIMKRKNEAIVTFEHSMAIANCQMLKSDDVLQILGISPQTLIDLRDMGILKGTKIGRGYKYSQAEVLEFQKHWIGYDLSGREEMIKALQDMKAKEKKVNE